MPGGARQERGKEISPRRITLSRPDAWLGLRVHSWVAGMADSVALVRTILGGSEPGECCAYSDNDIIEVLCQLQRNQFKASRAVARAVLPSRTVRWLDQYCSLFGGTRPRKRGRAWRRPSPSPVHLTRAAPRPTSPRFTYLQVLDDREGVVAMALFPLISMLNHSCEPNLRPIIETGFFLEFIALRDIAAGEELVFSYVPTDAPKAERNEVLREKCAGLAGAVACLLKLMAPTTLHMLWPQAANGGLTSNVGFFGNVRRYLFECCCARCLRGDD